MILPQAPSYSAFPFLGEARGSSVRISLILRAVATSRASIAGSVLSGRAAARMGGHRRAENCGAFQGSSAGIVTAVTRICVLQRLYCLTPPHVLALCLGAYGLEATRRKIRIHQPGDVIRMSPYDHRL